MEAGQPPRSDNLTLEQWLLQSEETSESASGLESGRSGVRTSAPKDSSAASVDESLAVLAAGQSFASYRQKLHGLPHRATWLLHIEHFVYGCPPNCKIVGVLQVVFLALVVGLRVCPNVLQARVHILLAI